MTDNPEAGDSTMFLEQDEQGHLIHDMKSPYNGIVGLSEPMAKMAKEPEKKRQLTFVNQCGARWYKYIEATVEAEPLSIGQIEIKGDQVDIGSLVEEACEIMSMARDMEERPFKSPDVKVENKVPTTPTVVMGSVVHTAKSVYHLIMNAFKFTDSGTVTLSHRPEDAHVVLIVQDTGIGIPADQLDRVCLPFVKLTDRRPFESLGLGLCSTKEYIEFVGGKLILSSSSGVGTTAELWIPKLATNVGTHKTGPFGFGHYSQSLPLPDRWLLQKRALGMLTVDLLPAHFGIAGMADALVNNEPKPTAKKQLAMIQRSGNRVLEVLSLLRDSTLRSEPGIMPSIRPAVSFVQIVERIIADLSKALDKRGQPMKKKTVEFSNGVYPGNSPFIDTDPAYLCRVVYQLCDNALKFTAEGKVGITTSESPGRGLMIQVSDSGCGFDMAKLETIFKPLHRLEPETYYGLGLGLNMVRDMCARIGASIEFSSEKGKGTTVTIVVGDGTAVAQGVGELAEGTPVSSEGGPPPSLVPASEHSDTEKVQAVVEVPKSPVENSVKVAAEISEKVNAVLKEDIMPVIAPVVEAILTEPEKVVELVVPSVDIVPKVAPLQETVVAPVPAVPEPDVIAPAAAPVVPPKVAPVVAPAVSGVAAEEPVVSPAAVIETGGGPQFTYADMPKDEDDPSLILRKTLAGDKYRQLVEMDDGTEQSTFQSSMGNLQLAVEVLKERISVANSISANIKSMIKQIESKHR